MNFLGEFFFFLSFSTQNPYWGQHPCTGCGRCAKVSVLQEVFASHSTPLLQPRLNPQASLAISFQVPGFSPSPPLGLPEHQHLLSSHSPLFLFDPSISHSLSEPNQACSGMFITFYPTFLGNFSWESFQVVRLTLSVRSNKWKLKFEDLG